MSSIIHVENLTRTFGKIVAVDHISLEVKEGEIFGFLGPNGAGKTTTLRLLCGLLKPDDGKATVGGHDVAQEANVVRSIVGLLPEPELSGLYERMTPIENLTYFARLYGLPERQIDDRIKELLNMMDLHGRRNDRVATFSRGMRQKLSIARAIIHDPKILFMDEPTTGLDPEAAKSFREFIARLCKQLNRTVFLCTHNLPEADMICDRIAIINQGRLATIGETSELEKSLWTRRVFTLSLLPGFDKSVIERLPDIGSIDNLKLRRNTLQYETDKPDKVNPLIVQRIVESGGRIVTLQEERKTLEDVYMKIIGQAEGSS
ncbi:MAG: ABC transporter ATP-binding protein [Candidatus Atabeyarchaeum deiterrae]|jgi:ABC-2 type transport system ATP-binding protein